MEVSQPGADCSRWLGALLESCRTLHHLLRPSPYILWNPSILTVRVATAALCKVRPTVAFSEIESRAYREHTDLEWKRGSDYTSAATT